MSTLRHILALNIRERRYVLGLSQAKLAEASGIATAYVAMIELEKKFPSVDVLERIAKALNIDPPELFSKACYPKEAILELHKAISKDIEAVSKCHIEKFEENVNYGKFCESDVKHNKGCFPNPIFSFSRSFILFFT